MADAVIDINPADIRSEEVDFTEDLPLDSNITVSTSAYDSAGEAASIIQGTSTSGMVLTITYSGGEDGEDYLVGISALGDVSSNVFSKVFEIRCRANGGMF